jgi:hypothetical protein
MQHYQDDWIREWCSDNGWTDLFRERYNHYWAFPPNAVMPEPIPPQVLRLIKKQKGLCSAEKIWTGLAIATTISGVIFSYFLQSPMPLVFAFAFAAIAVAKLEMEEI